MLIRRSALIAAGVLAASTIVGSGLSIAGAASDNANGSLPFITGGGHTQNFNSEGNPEGPPLLTNYGGFNARATVDNGDGTYVADGEVQGRASDDESHQTVGKLHGDVVCIADRGGPTDQTGGDPEGGDVWEIRFQIERVDNEDVSETPVYGSIFVQDNGPQNDFSDENLDTGAAAVDPNCGDITAFQLEPHQGQITVHNG